MMMAWLPGSAARVERARAALPLVLDGWLEVGGVPLSRLGVLRPLALGSAAAWARMPTLLREAAEAVARFSQTMRTDHGSREDELRSLTEHVAQQVDRLAAWVVIDLGLPVDRPAVLAEADEFLQEVEAEDDGLLHATDAITGLFQERLGDRERASSERELERHAVAILAPLLAQAACLRWSDGGT